MVERFEKNYDSFNLDTKATNKSNSETPQLSSLPEDDLEVQALSTAELFKQSLDQPDLIDNLYEKLTNSPQLISKLGLEGKDEFEIKHALAKSKENLFQMGVQLADIIELIAIILVSPKNLLRLKNLKKTATVVTLNQAIIEQISEELKTMASDESKLKVAFAHIARLALESQPTSQASKFTAAISKLLGIVSEEDYQNMKSTAKGIETPTLNLWVMMHTLLDNPQLTQDIYNTISKAYKLHTSETT